MTNTEVPSSLTCYETPVDKTALLEVMLDAAKVNRHNPRLLSDNGASYVSGELADWLKEVCAATNAIVEMR